MRVAYFPFLFLLFSSKPCLMVVCRQSQTDEKLQAVSEAAEVKPQHDVEADETNTGTHHSADGMTFADGLTCTKGTAHTEQVLAHTKRERLCGGKPLIPSSRGRRPKIGGTCSKKKLTPSNQDGPPEAGLACGEKMLMPSGPGEPPKTDGVCSRKSTPSGPDKLPQTDREGSRKTSTPSGSGGQVKRKDSTSATGQVGRAVCQAFNDKSACIATTSVCMCVCVCVYV